MRSGYTYHSYLEPEVLKNVLKDMPRTSDGEGAAFCVLSNLAQ